MIGFVIICFIIPIIIGCISFSQDGDSEGAFAVTVGSFFIIIIIYFIAGITLEREIDIKQYEVKQYNISGLENKTTEEFEMKGSFVTAFTIGYGSVSAESETEMNYWYFKETEYGKKIESIPCDEVWIREVEDGESCLIHVVQETTFKGNPLLSKIFCTISEDDYTHTNEIEKILQVPVGTVRVEYNVDF